RCHFAVETAFRTSKSLIFLASSWVGGVLMNFDVRRIQVPQFSFGVLGKKIENSGPDTLMSPAQPARINRTPRTKSAGNVTPGTSASQDVDHSFYHQPIILWRSATTAVGSRFSKIVRLIFLAVPRAGPEQSVVHSHP